MAGRKKIGRKGAGLVKRPLKQIARELKVETGRKDKKRNGKKAQVSRRETQREKRNFGLYDPADRILLVDEGNFTFARALGRRLGDCKGVLATATESKADVEATYPEAAAVRQEVEEKLGGTTLVGVDPTRLHKVSEFKGAFHKIVWLFPHIDTEETDFEKIAEMHQKLFIRFFKSAVKCLDPSRGSAAIHVALTQGEPFKSWKLVKTAKDACEELELKRCVPFDPAMWKGYERPSMFDPGEGEREANLYVFCRKSIMQFG